MRLRLLSGFSLVYCDKLSYEKPSLNHESVPNLSYMWICVFLGNVHVCGFGSMFHFLTLVDWQVWYHCLSLNLKVSFWFWFRKEKKSVWFCNFMLEIEFYQKGHYHIYTTVCFAILAHPGYSDQLHKILNMLIQSQEHFTFNQA